MWLQCVQRMFCLRPQVLASFRIAKHHVNHQYSNLELWPHIPNELEYKHKMVYSSLVTSHAF